MLTARLAARSARDVQLPFYSSFVITAYRGPADCLLLCRNIFTDSGVEWKNYRYFDPQTVGLDFKGMTEDLRNAPDGSVVVLHGKCCFS